MRERLTYHPKSPYFMVNEMVSCEMMVSCETEYDHEMVNEMMVSCETIYEMVSGEMVDDEMVNEMVSCEIPSNSRGNRLISSNRW